MPSAAAKAQEIVHWAARPYRPGDTPGRQIKRAAERLGLHKSETDFNKVVRAFYGKAKAPTLVDIEDKANRSLEYRVWSLIEAMNATDPDFFEHHIQVLGELLRHDNVPVRPRLEVVRPSETGAAE